MSKRRKQRCCRKSLTPIATRNSAAHDFRSIASPRDFQARVPPTTYDDYRDSIARIAGGERNVLTRERVRLLEPTSGSSGGEKWIAYTSGLRRQFQRGVAAWIADLFQARPAVRRGRAYWSISPASGRVRRTAAGIPIGFDDDAAYLGTIEQWALRRLLVAPSNLARFDDLKMFRYCTLLCLLAADDLALISVWSPTFLTVLFAPLADWLGPLCRDLRNGTVTGPDLRGLQCNWRPPFRADLRRADTVAAIAGPLAKSGTNLPEALREIWPRLALVSCWTDAVAGRAVSDVQTLFPLVEIQPKGLLATEGIVSIPFIDCPAPALALRSHFFEFAEDDSAARQTSGAASAGSQRFRLAHEVELGGRYQIVLTTAGGLYRYRLGDEVEIVGRSGQCPLLQFVGRGDRVSDMVGEKLAESHVRLSVDRALAECGPALRFALLVPVARPTARYRLYVQFVAGTETDASELVGVQPSLEGKLAENPHYRYAVGLGQLAPVEIRLLDSHAESAWQVYEQRCIARGQRVGNIKPVALDTWDGWPAAFAAMESPATSRSAADKSL